MDGSNICARTTLDSSSPAAITHYAPRVGPEGHSSKLIQVLVLLLTLLTGIQCCFYQPSLNGGMGSGEAEGRWRLWGMKRGGWHATSHHFVPRREWRVNVRLLTQAIDCVLPHPSAFPALFPLLPPQTFIRPYDVHTTAWFLSICPFSTFNAFKQFLLLFDDL